MELEYKFALDSAEQGTRIAEALVSGTFDGVCVTDQKRIEMASTYYDTASGSLSRAGYALRLRQENDVRVCCVKFDKQVTSDGLARRGEIECECQTLTDGVRGLIARGAPAEFAVLCGEEFAVKATMRFTRRAYTLETGAVQCELAIDSGCFGEADAAVPFCELEIELKDGDEAEFLMICKKIAEKYALKPQALSKLARALAAKTK